MAHSEVPTEVQIARINLGLCPTCGIQTQERNKLGQFVPITNIAVRNSRCLLCNPLHQKSLGESINSSLHEEVHLPSPIKLFQEGWNFLMGDNHFVIDKPKGESLIVLAMNRGYIAGKGFCLFRGWGGLKQSYSQAYRIFLEGVQGEDVTSFAMIGYFYLNGYGVNKDRREAIKWLETAARKGHSWAANMTAFHYQIGEIVDKDEKKSLDLHFLAARNGYSRAKYNLAQIYSDGIGVKPDKKMSITWLEKAAQQGHAKAIKKLGLDIPAKDLMKKSTSNRLSIDSISSNHSRDNDTIQSQLTCSTASSTYSESAW